MAKTDIVTEALKTHFGFDTFKGNQKAIIENVQKFEASHGEIKDMETVELPFNFGGPPAQA